MAAALADRGLSTTLLGPAPRVRELLHTIGAQDLLEWRDRNQFTAP